MVLTLEWPDTFSSFRRKLELIMCRRGGNLESNFHEYDEKVLLADQSVTISSRATAQLVSLLRAYECAHNRGFLCGLQQSHSMYYF